VSLSSDRRTLAVGGYADGGNKGATWIFVSTGTTYQQLGMKLVGSGSNGSNVYQGTIILGAYYLAHVLMKSHRLVD
jgi:hypothetical protein